MPCHSGSSHVGSKLGLGYGLVLYLLHLLCFSVLAGATAGQYIFWKESSGNRERREIAFQVFLQENPEQWCTKRPRFTVSSDEEEEDRPDEAGKDKDGDH
eukprot:4150458-Lingulodinium_polyedra.AAC.1